LLTTGPGEKDLLLSLFAESLQLLNPTGRASANAWRHTFTSFVQAQDNLADFRWRGGWPGTPGFAKVKQAGGIVLEPRAIVAPLSELAIIAREGKVPVPVTQADVEPRRPAATSIATTLPPAKPRLLPVSPRKPSIKARLLERGHRSMHELDTEIGLPAAPQGEHRSWLTWLLAFASSLVVCLLATYPLWKGALQDLKKPSPRKLSTPASPALPPPPPNTTSAPPPRLSTQGPIWVFLGKRWTDDMLKEIPLLTNLMSQMGGASSSADIHCILLKTNEFATDLVFKEHGQRLEVTEQRHNRLHLDWHFRLGYEAESRGVKWLPDPEEGKLSLNQEQTNFFWTSITFAWTDRVSGRPTNVTLALLNCRTDIGSSPFLFSKHDLIPDKSGTDRYAPDLARFLEQFKLGAAFEWRLVPYIDSKSLYHDWVTNSAPEAGEEINFAGVRSRLEGELKRRQRQHSDLPTEIARLHTRIQEIEGEHLQLGRWLEVKATNLHSFERFCQGAMGVIPATVVFRNYLDAVAERADGFQLKKDWRELAAIRNMFNTNNSSGACSKLDDRLNSLGISIGTNSIRNYYDNIGARKASEYARRAKDLSDVQAKLDQLCRLDREMTRLQEQIEAVAEGCWDKITQLELRIERKKPVSRKGETESVVFMKFQ
ncbi:MAG TPA: hypothetical protein PKM43_11175, partial [Verrucomicrobiota bacterium]|nr:hypothetical protein [Verrucomicrobiota bacterium]